MSDASDPTLPAPGEDEVLREALTEVMSWIDNWDPNFIHDDEWPATRDKARAALSRHSTRTSTIEKE